MQKIECEFDCPHCNQGFTIVDGMYRDDVEDECFSTCECCGGVYQLRCVSVKVEMEALPVKNVANDAFGLVEPEDKWKCPECGRHTESAFNRCDDCAILPDVV